MVQHFNLVKASTITRAWGPDEKSKHNDESRDETQNDTQAPKGLIVKLIGRKVAQKMSELGKRSPTW